MMLLYPRKMQHRRKEAKITTLWIVKIPDIQEVIQRLSYWVLMLITAALASQLHKEKPKVHVLRKQ